jgi:hypothetical protein
VPSDFSNDRAVAQGAAAPLTETRHNHPMAKIPWIRILDTVVGLADAGTRRSARRPSEPPGTPDAPSDRLMSAAGHRGGFDARLAGVMIAALKETFDRDTRRLELEREYAEAERERAERALRLELLRQVGEREIGRLRLLAGVAVVTWLTTLFFAARVMAGPLVPRVVVGIGWALLLVALGCAFAAQSRVGDALRRAAVSSTPPETIDGGAIGAFAQWLIVAGLALVGTAALI